MTKTCTRCNEVKEDTLFSWKNKTLGIRMGHCKACHSLYAKQHYIANKAAYVARAKASSSDNYAKTRELVLSLKVHCVKCGENHPAALDFHHTDPTQKEIAISAATSRKVILAEVEKCIVLCANCHRKLHWDSHNT